jgi:Xaa-Pro aminopeptidase
LKLYQGQPWILPGVSDDEIQRRHQRVKEEMKKRDISCLVVAGSQVSFGSGGDNVRYLSNFGLYYGEAYIVFPLSGEPRLLLRSVNSEFNTRTVSFVPTQVSGYPFFARDIANYITQLNLAGENIGIVSAEIMPTNVFLDLKQRLPKANFFFVTDILLQMRLIKSPEELAFVEKAGEIADYAYDAIMRTAKPGRKEYEIFGAVEEALTSHGANSPSFVLICSGPSPSFPNCPSSHRNMELHDTILNEISPCYGGYWVQWGRAMSIGEADNELYKLFDVTMEVYQIISKALKPGTTFEQVTNAGHELILSKGHTWLAPATQWVGLDLTEFASMAKGTSKNLEMVPRPFDKRPLEPGMVIVNQPNVVKKDLTKGMLIIDTFIVTEDGCKVVSKAPLEYRRV